MVTLSKHIYSPALCISLQESLVLNFRPSWIHSSLRGYLLTLLTLLACGRGGEGCRNWKMEEIALLHTFHLNGRKL